MKCLECRKILETTNIHGLHLACWEKCFGSIQEFTELDPKKLSFSGESIKQIKDTFYQGQYLKYSAQIGSIKYILKVQEEKFLDLPEMEYVCNQIAESLNIKVPDYYLIRLDYKNSFDKNNIQDRKVFVTKNFMQNQTGTLNHIYKYLPEGKVNYTCKNIINVLLEQTNNLKSAETFVDLCLFDSFIGNNDRHGRNLGIIDFGKGKKLAPLYDNPSYLGIAKDDLLKYSFNISGCIRTSRTEKPKVKDYIQEFNALGFNKVCLKFIDRVFNQHLNIENKVNVSEISERRKKAFICFLQSRQEDFQNV